MYNFSYSVVRDYTDYSGDYCIKFYLKDVFKSYICREALILIIYHFGSLKLNSAISAREPVFSSPSIWESVQKWSRSKSDGYPMDSIHSVRSFAKFLSLQIFAALHWVSSEPSRIPLAFLSWNWIGNFTHSRLETILGVYLSDIEIEYSSELLRKISKNWEVVGYVVNNYYHILFF